MPFPNEKALDDRADVETATVAVDAISEKVVLSTERDIATHIISVDDDSNLNPWTLRAFVIGIGLSTFGGVLGWSSSTFFPTCSEFTTFFLAEIYYFKPVRVVQYICQYLPLRLSPQQAVLVSLMFTAVISYVLGFFMETFIPRRGLFRYLNPVSHPLNILFIYFSLNNIFQGPFNKKENAFIVIMASASANSALGTEVLAVQR